MGDLTLATGRQENRSTSGGGTVFVVDDDAGVGQSFQLLMSSLHMDVTAFQCAEDLLACLACRVPDCIITEVYLPGMSGIDLLRELRARGHRIPVIVMATHADVPLAVEAMQLGALDFVEKPFVDRVVVSRVKQVLRGHGEDSC